MRRAPGNRASSGLLVIALAFSVIFAQASCIPMKGEEETSKSPERRPTKTLTVYLLDASGSFNRRQAGGQFDEQNYFDLACDQVRHHLQEASDVDAIFAYSVSSSSQNDDNLILSLELGKITRVFTEPEPPNIFRRKQWERRKADFDRSLAGDLKRYREAAIAELEQFRRDHLDRPADYTDLYTAIWVASGVLNDPSYSSMKRQLIIFSDFQDNKTRTMSPLQLPGVEVIGRFVSRNNHTRETYDSLLRRWRFIIRAQRLALLPPERSY